MTTDASCGPRPAGRLRRMRAGAVALGVLLVLAGWLVGDARGVLAAGAETAEGKRLYPYAYLVANEDTRESLVVGEGYVIDIPQELDIPIVRAAPGSQEPEGAVTVEFRLGALAGCTFAVAPAAGDGAPLEGMRVEVAFANSVLALDVACVAGRDGAARREALELFASLVRAPLPGDPELRFEQEGQGTRVVGPQRSLLVAHEDGSFDCVYSVGEFVIKEYRGVAHSLRVDFAEPGVSSRISVVRLPHMPTGV